MLKNKKSYLLKNIEMKCIYTAVFLCITSIGLAQSLSFSEALDRMRGANQKLKGMAMPDSRLESALPTDEGA